MNNEILYKLFTVENFIGFEDVCKKNLGGTQLVLI